MSRNMTAADSSHNNAEESDEEEYDEEEVCLKSKLNADSFNLNIARMTKNTRAKSQGALLGQEISNLTFLTFCRHNLPLSTPPSL